MRSRSSLNLRNMDSAFGLAALLAGHKLTFRLEFVDGPIPDLLDRLHGIDLIANVYLKGRAVIVEFDHVTCDGLSGIEIVRSALYQNQPRKAAGVAVFDAQVGRRHVTRRYIARLAGSCAYLIDDTIYFNRYVTTYFEGVWPQAGAGTFTERLTAALHEEILARWSPVRKYSSILVPVTLAASRPGRPIGNLSGGFLSVTTGRDRAYGSVRDRVAAQFHAARLGRARLVERVAKYGLIPRRAWPALAKFSNLLPKSAESAVVSNLGAVDRDNLACDCRAIFFVPPVRHRYTICLGVVRYNDQVNVTLSGFTSVEELRGIGRRVLSGLLFNLREVCL